MSALVVALAAVVALFCVLVVGVLRSHAAILERLDALDPGPTSEPPTNGLDGATSTRRGEQPPPQDHSHAAVDLDGLATDGAQPVAVRVTGVEHDTLVAFLSSTCITCQRFWDAFRTPRGLGLPTGTRLVVVTKGPDAESPTSVAKLAPPGVPTVMSTEAFGHYAVPGAPYFVLVHGPSGRVLAADTGSDWEHVQPLLHRPADDQVG